MRSDLSRRSRFVPAALVASLVFAACTSTGEDSSSESSAPEESNDAVTISDDDAPDDDAPGDTSPTTEPAPRPPRFRYPVAPTAPAAEVQSAADTIEIIDRVVEAISQGNFDLLGVQEIGETGDPRHAWLLSDLLRFFRGDDGEIIVTAFEQLTGVEISNDPESAISPWLSVTNHLFAWDTPAYPGYQEDKAGIFLQLEEGWTPFFEDEDANIDWRTLSWGGVFIDDRELGDPNGCPGGCIPALDDPTTTDAAGGDWYPDEMIVFGLIEGDEALAFPKNIAEIHEMFNLTLGGRRFGVPYCTLCGSAQAYYTDDSEATLDGEPIEPVLRTSGLLTRSNKVMYDLLTRSVFDTFTGEAVSGPLLDQGVALEEATLVRATWGEWKAAHPDTQIIAEDGGIGRSYELDPLAGRDDDGPIFPIGAADERLDVQELVVGVIAADGTPVAFPSDASSAILAAGGDVTLAGVTLVEDADGLRAVDAASGESIAAHEAFWFAWSQFHPDTELFVP